MTSYMKVSGFCYVISHSTMNYREVMTKLNENNVTFVIQTISSMNYFDSSKTKVARHVRIYIKLFVHTFGVHVLQIQL
jgi:hypothetical protein